MRDTTAFKFLTKPNKTLLSFFRIELIILLLESPICSFKCHINVTLRGEGFKGSTHMPCEGTLVVSLILYRKSNGSTHGMLGEIR